MIGAIITLNGKPLLNNIYQSTRIIYIIIIVVRYFFVLTSIVETIANAATCRIDWGTKCIEVSVLHLATLKEVNGIPKEFGRFSFDYYRILVCHSNIAVQRGDLISIVFVG